MFGLLFKVIAGYFIFNYLTTMTNFSLDSAIDFITKAGECIVEIIVQIL